MPTTSTVIGRQKISHPDLDHDGGSGLHTKITTLLKTLSDNANARFFRGDGTTNLQTFEHNLGCEFSGYQVYIYTATSAAEADDNNLTRVTDPVGAGWTIAATAGNLKTQIDITPPSALHFRAVVIQGAPFDLTSEPEDGQAMVYDDTSKTFKPGASGDASFKFQSLSSDGTALVVKSGFIILSDNRELRLVNDLTIDLTAAPHSISADGDYYGYINLKSLPAAVDLNGRSVIQITNTEFDFSTSTPIGGSRPKENYLPLGTFQVTTGGTVFTNVQTTAFRRHDFKDEQDWEISDIASNVATIKGGYLWHGGTEYATHDGSNAGADISINLKTEVSTLGVTSPAASTAYTLYIDTAVLQTADEITTGTTDRAVTKVEKGTSGALTIILSTTSVDRNRYIPLTSLKTDGSSDYTAFETNFAKRILASSETVGLTSRTATLIAEQAVGTPGSSGQVALGHQLDEDSFYDDVTNETVIYRLEDLTEETGQLGNLTDPTSIAFDDTDIFGTASNVANFDGTKYVHHANNAFYNSYAGDFTINGLCRADDLTPGANQTIVSDFNASGNDAKYALIIQSSGQLEILYSLNGTALIGVQGSFPAGISDGDWFSFQMTYNATTFDLKAYIDGQLVINGNIGSALHAPATSRFNIGGRNNGDTLFTGTIHDVSFTKRLCADAELTKLRSTKVDLTGVAAVIGKEAQHYEGEYSNGDVRYHLDNQLVLDKKDTKVYVDFSSFSSTDLVSLELFNKGAAATTVAVQPFSRTYTSALPATIAHNQAGVPKFEVLESTDSGATWNTIDSGFLSSDATTTTILSSPFTPTTSHQLWIRTAGQVLSPVKTKYQEKILGSDVTTDTDFLVFNNLVVGRTYQFTFTLRIVNGKTGIGTLNFMNGATVVCEYSVERPATTSNQRFPLSATKIRTATDTTFKLNTAGWTGITIQAGFENSFATVKDITDTHEVTTDWT